MSDGLALNLGGAAAPFGLLGLAGLLFLLPSRRGAGLIVLAALAVVAWALTMRLAAPEAAPVFTALGGWSESVGGGFRLDAYAAGAGLILCLSAGFSALAGLEERLDWQSAPVAALRLAWAGAGLAALSSVSVFSLVGWLLVADLALVAALALQSGDRAALALAGAGQLLVWRCMAAGLSFLGLAFLYAAAGRLDAVALSAALHAAPGDGRAAVGGVLVLAGVLSLAGAPPLQAGAATSTAAARAPALLLLLGAMVLGLAAAGRVLALFLDADREEFVLAIALLSGLGALWAGGRAVFASSLSGMAAALVAAQLFGAVLGLALREPVLAIAQALAVLVGGLAVWLGVDLLRRRFGAAQLDALHGVGRLAPLETIVLVAGALSLAGAPFLFGFLVHFELLGAAAASRSPGAAVLLVLAELGCVLAALRLTLVLCVSPSPRTDAPKAPLAWATLPLGLLAALACLVFGLVLRPDALAGVAIALELRR